MTGEKNYLAKAVKNFMALFIVAIPIVWLALTQANFEGDLTRIGKLSENDFGWRLEQEKIHPNLLIQHPINEADTLVIGDSFSVSMIWQTILLKNDLKPITYHWNNIGPICDNFNEIIANSGFKGKRIIFQIIELGAEERIKKSLNCIAKSKNSFEAVTVNKEILTQLDFSQKLNLSGRFLVGLQTKINNWGLNLFKDYWAILNKRSKSSYLIPIENGCIFFSNSLCHLGLFYHQDYTKPSIPIETATKIEVINDTLKNYQITWLIIPNKSSVYHRTIDATFWQELEKKGLGPNLHNSFLKNKYLVKDLYKPNDSHLSNQGYIELGTITYEFISKQANEASKAMK
jgi:hypothetical protein